MNKRAEHIINHAEQACKAHGARLTSKRKKVLSGLVQSEKALSAYELIDFYKSEFSDSIQAMSMYRILDFLQGEHLVHKLNTANKYIACSHITCDHNHAIPQFLVCDECQKVKEVDINQSTIAELTSNVEQAGFYLSGFQLEINCLCESCGTKVA